MARFFTHLDNHHGLQCDREGQEFSDLDQALRQAAQSAGAVLAEDLAAGRSPVRVSLFVEDEEGVRRAAIIAEGRVERPTG